MEHWSGPDQAVLHTVSVHLRSRFADRVWDDAPPGYLAALYLLASKERLWQPALPALSHDSIDFSRIVSKPHGFAIQDYPIFYSARRLYDLKSPMEAEDLAHPKLVSDLDFHNIIYATTVSYTHLLDEGPELEDGHLKASRPQGQRSNTLSQIWRTDWSRDKHRSHKLICDIRKSGSRICTHCAA